MKRSAKIVSIFMVVMLLAACLLGGCGANATGVSTGTETASGTTDGTATGITDGAVPDGTADSTAAGGESASAEVASEPLVFPEDGNYLLAAISVYYNDSDSAYYTFETGDPIVITGDGQYTLSFDCEKDLSEAAKSAGVRLLKNLTAIYLMDVGETQSPIRAADIMWDSVVVNGTALTVTQTAPKSAIKSTGLFDTNDPINAWDGSQVEEIDCNTSSHVANFSTIDKPTTISITFTLSGVSFTEAAASTDKTAETSTEEDVVVNTYQNLARFSDMDFTKVTSLELISYLGNGINLGNTMEATIVGRNPATTAVSSFETAWGQPITTPEMLQGMKDCGFDTVRIPVAWTSVMDYTNGDFTIREDFMDRVEEIVNYALDAEMFVVLNDHWDYGWWAMFGSDKQEDVDTAWAIYENMWTQIAERFADYGDMLIFESANEELGNNLNNNANWASSGHLKKSELYTVSNAINQRFVDIVRASGGNNDDRFLLIAGINTNIADTCKSDFVMPTDSAKDKLLLSVHFYDPWSYCGDKEGDSTRETDNYAQWGVKKDFTTMENTLSQLSKFTGQGIGVIIGEWGPLPVYEKDTGNSHLVDNSETYMSYFLDICDRSSFCPILWTTNSFYNKNTLSMITEGVGELFTSRCYAEEVAAGDGYLARVEEDMKTLYEAAPEHFESNGTVYGSDASVAYIMWNGGAGSYNVGDTYNPDDCSNTIVPTDVIVDGEGTYTVRLDFPGGNDGLTFGALALNAGEVNFPGGILDIKSVVVTDKDGSENKLKLIALPYTASDDGTCTRVNLINPWVSAVPDDARNAQNYPSIAQAVVLDSTDLTGIYSIEITFELIVK